MNGITDKAEAAFGNRHAHAAVGTPGHARTLQLSATLSVLRDPIVQEWFADPADCLVSPDDTHPCNVIFMRPLADHRKLPDH